MRDCVLRVGGRIDQADVEDAHPIILPRHALTELIIRDTHERNAHAGSNHVLTALRQKYYILRGYSEVKRILETCIPCKRHHAKPAEQLMASLPRERVDVGKNPPFTYTGVDYFGPMSVKYRRGTVKRYGCIFTCLVTRAVHIEVAHSMDSDSFLMALHRFIARRGKPQKCSRTMGPTLWRRDKELADEIRTQSTQ